jgi:hypothetical protein
MVSEIDGLNVRLGADFSDLDRAFAGLDKTVGEAGASLDRSLGSAFDATGDRMGAALERFAQRGTLSFTSLRSAGMGAARDILSGFLDIGLQDLGLGSAGIFSKGAVGNVLDGLFGRASGGPVSAGVPYLVGERGPELFVPRAPGRIARGGGGGGTAVTVNVYGAADAPQVRKSAGQIAAAVVLAVRRGQRNL